MCGLLYAQNLAQLNEHDFRRALARQRWRGPDKEQVESPVDGVFLGHVRLAIIDPDERASQPFASGCGRYRILFNGEIYNHKEIRQQLNLRYRTGCDTETILEAFIQRGDEIFDRLEGMFALVIFDCETGDFWTARDRYGIKPLFQYESPGGALIFSSECVSIRELVPCQVDPCSVQEWKLIRRPMYGRSFFKEITEVLPGSLIKNGRLIRRMQVCMPSQTGYSETEIERLLKESVREHELSDVQNVALLSGGIDSTLITAYSQCSEVYTVGTAENNEFDAAAQTSNFLGRDLNVVEVEESHIKHVWRDLIALKGEPLSVPNEALIYSVCKAMSPQQKVVLTGEGADEVFFGYDRVFRWAAGQDHLSLEEFFEYYAYSGLENLTKRLRKDLETLLADKTPIKFVEDFFFHYHLPCLLRRMDFASMAASKEARVPFVCSKIINYMYRRPSVEKINEAESKIPLRRMINNAGLDNVLTRKKIGFSATLQRGDTRHEEYRKFQHLNLEALGWL